MYIVVATFYEGHIQDNDDTDDRWVACETLNDAEHEYDSFIDQGARSVSICQPIKSTDYMTKGGQE